MSVPGEPQPVSTAVELLTLYLGPNGPLEALNHWERAKGDWGGNGEVTGVLALLDMNKRLLFALAQVSGADDPNAFAVEYLRALALGSEGADDT